MKYREWYRSGHNELHWNCSSRACGPWVRIPPAPPKNNDTGKKLVSLFFITMKMGRNMNEERIGKIQKPLVKWYQENKRILPWREDKDPYKIWISEIMLQQTRIEAVKSYYARFMEELPTVKDLAEIPEEKLLKLWEGLGYYSRARNLKKAARKIMDDYNQKMPETYEELLNLPGIGAYTAGAIASIAYNEKIPAVDGNVLRVISRILGSKKDIMQEKTKKEVTEVLKKNMPEEAGDFNEGLMELGETICIPNGEPLCDKCPLKDHCVAQKENLTLEIPVRILKVKRKIEERTVFLFTHSDEVAICKRKDTGLLAGMYEFPNILGVCSQEEIKKQLQKWKLVARQVNILPKAKHIFSHIEWNMVAYHIEVQEKNTEFLWVKKEELKTIYAIPGAFEKYKNTL